MLESVTQSQRRTGVTAQLHGAPRAAEVVAARQAEYVGFLHRHPWATDAFELGFATGVREDYQLQDAQFDNVDVPVMMLDNDFENPDLTRYLERFRQYDPDIGILGDAYTAREATQFLEAACDLKQSRNDSLTLIVVPKSESALDVLCAQSDVVLGFAMGYSQTQALDFSDPVDWRGQDVHLLGASPPKQYSVIQDLTQPTITGEPPANIVGVDWNGLQKIAYKGEAWTRNGWRSADHLSIRETVRHGLREIKAFWQERGVWPDTEPTDAYAPAVMQPDDPIFTASGRDIRERESLEDAIVVEYDNGRTLAYQTERERAYIEHRHGVPPSVA